MFHVPICVFCLSFFASHAVTTQSPRKAWLCLPYRLPSASSGVPQDARAFSSALWTSPALSHSSYAICSSLQPSWWPFTGLWCSNLFPGIAGPKLDMVLQIWSQKCWTEGKDQYTWPAGHSPANTALHGLPLPCCEGTLMDNSCLVNQQDSQVIFCKADSCPVRPQPTPPEVTVFQMMKSALACTEFHKASVSTVFCCLDTYEQQSSFQCTYCFL